MTRNNDSSYREQGRAVFLAAIMVVSVVAASAAFAGGAAATLPESTDSIDGEVVYPGQDFNVSVDNGDDDFGESAYLVRVTRDGGDIQDTNVVESLEITNGTGVQDPAHYLVETGGLEAGSSYAISNTSQYRGSNGTTLAQQFSIINEGFDAEFDGASVDENSNESVVELSSDRPISQYNLTISASGPETLDVEALQEIFTGGDDASVSDSAYAPIDYLDGYDRGDGDTIDNLEEDDYYTIDLSNGSVNTNSDGDLVMNYTRLDDQLNLPDDGDYEFEFIVTDTGSTATDSLTIAKSDEDAEFDQTSEQTPAGDIASYNISLTDTEDAYVQFGGPDSQFVDVWYLDIDDPDEKMQVQVNTRLLGTSADPEAVFDTTNVDTIQSEIHDGIDDGNLPDTGLYGDDGSPDNGFEQYVEDLGIVDDANNAGQQLDRPLQPTEYDVTIAGTAGIDADTGAFDADEDGAADTQLASKVTELTRPDVGDVVTWTAPEETADDETDIGSLLDSVTQRQEIALDDRLVVQVEATGIYGTMVANRSGAEADTNWDRLSDGVGTSVLNNVFDTGDENIDLVLEAEAATGNQDPLQIDLSDAPNDDVYVVLDEEGGQFFVIADTSEDGAFENGNAPSSDTTFDAEFELDGDDADSRYELTESVHGGDNGPNWDPFNSSNSNFPYVAQGNTLSSSTSFDLAPRSISFDNLNADELVQATNTENAEISGTTNVAPGSDAALRVESTDASSSFRLGNDVNVSEDGSVTTTYNLADQEVGDEFSLNYIVGGTQADSADGVIVEAVGDTDDGEETNETDDGGEDMDDGETEPADDGETNESTDDGGDDGSTDDGTPGFGAVVALIALIGAALLAVRRQD